MYDQFRAVALDDGCRFLWADHVHEVGALSVTNYEIAQRLQLRFMRTNRIFTHNNADIAAKYGAPVYLKENGKIGELPVNMTHVLFRPADDTNFTSLSFILAGIKLGNRTSHPIHQILACHNSLLKCNSF